MSLITPMLIHVRDHLTEQLITNIDASDDARVDVVKLGHLQGEPDPDDAPISVEVHHGDPEYPDDWVDEVVDYEMPSSRIYKRRFCLIIRCLLVDSGLDLEDAAGVMSTVLSRCEAGIVSVDWSTLVLTGNHTIVGCVEDVISRSIQGGGPDEHDWLGKVWWSILTQHAP